MENLINKYQEFRQKNNDYFKYCQNTINEIADKLVMTKEEYKAAVDKFEKETEGKKEEINKFVRKLEELRAQIMELDKQFNQESMQFETMARAFEAYKHEMKKREEYAILNQLDEEILNSFEKTMENPTNPYNKIYNQELELIKEIKKAQAGSN